MYVLVGSLRSSATTLIELISRGAYILYCCPLNRVTLCLQVASLSLEATTLTDATPVFTRYHTAYVPFVHSHRQALAGVTRTLSAGIGVCVGIAVGIEVGVRGGPSQSPSPPSHHCASTFDSTNNPNEAALMRRLSVTDNAAFIRAIPDFLWHSTRSRFLITLTSNSGGRHLPTRAHSRWVWGSGATDFSPSLLDGGVGTLWPTL